MSSIQWMVRPSVVTDFQTASSRSAPKRGLCNLGRIFSSGDEAVWKSVTTDGQTIRWVDDMGFFYEMAEYEVNQFASGL